MVGSGLKAMKIEQHLRIRVANGYDVYIGTGLLENCGRFVSEIFPQRSCMIVSETNVAPLYLKTVMDSCEIAGLSVSSFIFPAGEEQKNLSTFGTILNAFADARLTRKDFVIALGGGVCGDITGFAAGCYMRGIPFVQIPTTVLSMVDSSVGGKCAVDLPQGKNLAGVFHQPSLVLCDIDTLSTLPEAVFADGCAEAIKTGILDGKELYELLENGPEEGRLPQIISLCIAYKGGVVERDEKEMGERKLLNLGHTAGHAIEKCSRFTISHGRAVAIGTAMMARAADALSWSTEPLSEEVESLLKDYNLPVTTDFEPEQLLEAALSDKKRSGKLITIIMPEAIGHCVMREVTREQLLEVFTAGWR